MGCTESKNGRRDDTDTQARGNPDTSVERRLRQLEGDLAQQAVQYDGTIKRLEAECDRKINNLEVSSKAERNRHAEKVNNLKKQLEDLQAKDDAQIKQLTVNLEETQKQHSQEVAAVNRLGKKLEDMRVQQARDAAASKALESKLEGVGDSIHAIERQQQLQPTIEQMRTLLQELKPQP